MNGTVEIKAVTLVVEGVDEWGDLKIDHRGDSVTISVWDRSDMERSLRKYGAIRIHEEYHFPISKLIEIELTTHATTKRLHNIV